MMTALVRTSLTWIRAMKRHDETLIKRIRCPHIRVPAHVSRHIARRHKGVIVDVHERRMCSYCAGRFTRLFKFTKSPTRVKIDLREFRGALIDELRTRGLV